MKEYQASIWDGIVIAKVKKKMVAPPTLPGEYAKTFMYVRSAPLNTRDRVACDKCDLLKPMVAKNVVSVKFEGEQAFYYLLCNAHRDVMIEAYSPFSNTGGEKKLTQTKQAE